MLSTYHNLCFTKIDKELEKWFGIQLPTNSSHVLRFWLTYLQSVQTQHTKQKNEDNRVQNRTLKTKHQTGRRIEQHGNYCI